MSTIDVKKIKKNVNVSIQSKKYALPINKILQEWEDNSLNISTEVCESLLLSNKIAKSPTLLKVINVCELAEKILNLYSIEDSQKAQMIENVLSQIIQVDTTKLTTAISELNNINVGLPVQNKEMPLNNSLNNEVSVTYEKESTPIIEPKIESQTNNFSNEVISNKETSSEENNGTPVPNRRQLRNLGKKTEPASNKDMDGLDDRYNNPEYNIPDDFIFNG